MDGNPATGGHTRPPAGHGGSPRPVRSRTALVGGHEQVGEGVLPLLWGRTGWRGGSRRLGRVIVIPALVQRLHVDLCRAPSTGCRPAR